MCRLELADGADVPHLHQSEQAGTVEARFKGLLDKNFKAVDLRDILW